MTRCPGCGAEVDAHMTRCWECHEPIDTAAAELDNDKFDEEDDDLLDLDEDDGLDEDDEDDDDDDFEPPPRQQVKKRRRSRIDLEDAADALLGDDEDDEDSSNGDLHVPHSTVVAYVAQDEVQAGAISQLLSDCGIRNFAGSGTDTTQDDETESQLQVQVLKEDLAAAQRVIEDFTSEFDDFA